MKKNLSLIFVATAVAGCGCGSQPEPEYFHASGLPEGPTDPNYGNYEVMTTVYNYVKNEADLLVGYVNGAEYCKRENELFPKNFIDTDECLSSDLVTYYADIANKQNKLFELISDATEHVSPGGNQTYNLEEIKIDVDFSTFKLSSAMGTKVAMAGNYTITDELIFDLNVGTSGNIDGVIKNDIYDKFIGMTHIIDTDLTESNSVFATRHVAEQEYTLEESNGKWIITDKK